MNAAGTASRDTSAPDPAAAVGVIPDDPSTWDHKFPPLPPRKRLLPPALRGKPIRAIQRVINQRRFSYPNRNILAICQGKSGSTWLMRMLLEAPGYLPWYPDNIKQWTYHDLRRADFIPPPAGYTVTKVHTRPTPENIGVVHDAGHAYIVLIRDPRDIAVSWAFYRVLPKASKFWDGMVGLSVPQRLEFYIDNILDRTMDWAIDWRRHLHPQRGMMVQYEDMLADTPGVMRRVFAHLGLPSDDAFVTRSVEKHTFKAATGRDAGEARNDQFNRKGIRGDWKNHFTPELTERFRALAGSRMADLGYADW
jgi:hypothetical protein